MSGKFERMSTSLTGYNSLGLYVTCNRNTDRLICLASLLAKFQPHGTGLCVCKYFFMLYTYSWLLRPAVTYSIPGMKWYMIVATSYCVASVELFIRVLPQVAYAQSHIQQSSRICSDVTFCT